MFERFTESSRQTFVRAQHEARTLKHNYIGTEHLLLGLFAEEQSIASQALQKLDVTVDQVRVRVIRIVGSGENVTTGVIPHTPRAKKVLELALRESLDLKHSYVGTEHLLLGIARESEGVASRILIELNISMEQLRDTVLELIEQTEVVAQGQEAGPGSVQAVPIDGAVKLTLLSDEELRWVIARATEILAQREKRAGRG